MKSNAHVIAQLRGSCFDRVFKDFCEDLSMSTTDASRAQFYEGLKFLARIRRVIRRRERKKI